MAEALDRSWQELSVCPRPDLRISWQLAPDQYNLACMFWDRVLCHQLIFYEKGLSAQLRDMNHFVSFLC